MENRKHLGDGVYVHFNGYNFDISVNDHRNSPVVTLDSDIIDSLYKYKNDINNTERKDIIDIKI